jgi:hypothetical protein
VPIKSPEPSPTTFADVIATERAAIETRRRKVDRPRDPAASTPDPDRPSAAAAEPIGLALSGGGIRSATFSLGVLQELNERNLLGSFDYLSTVSGGGYIGAWWSALLSRSQLPPSTGSAADDYTTSTVQIAPGTLFPPRRTARPTRESRTLQHLRLHSNYLIPNLGLLTWDTWRAISVIGRNLVLTWLVLLPFVLGAITVTQLYFLITARPLVTDGNTVSSATFTAWWSAASPILTGMLSAIGALTFVWLRSQGQRRARANASPGMPKLGWWVSLAMMVTLLLVYLRSDNGFTAPTANAWRDEPEFSVAFFLALAALLLLWRHLTTRSGRIVDHDLRRNNVSIVQQLFVMALAAVAVLLVAGGLGHLLVGSTVAAAQSWAARAGGAASVIATLAGAGWTAFRKAGIGGGESSMMTRIVMRVTPGLLVVALCAALATLSRDLILKSHASPLLFYGLVAVSFYGVALAWVYAAYETNWTALCENPWRARAAATLMGVAAGMVVYIADAPFLGTELRFTPMALAIVAIYTLARRLGAVLATDDEQPAYTDRRGRLVVEAITLGLFAAGIAIGRALVPVIEPLLPSVAVPAARAGVIGLIVTAMLATLTWRYGSGQRRKGLYLLLYAATVSLLWVAHARADWSATRAPLIDAFALLGATATWILAFGWATDPNNLALHAFYKARLVRCYLGASNALRHVRESLIDDSVHGDDVTLAEMKNTDRGAPYHIVNATLNLAGDQTLGSLQRQAAPFVFSRDFCGSPHPAGGFRPTRGYMGGALTLGTAVAISGAAASPEMGSQTPSGAMSMLMTLFNVRLGFWAPNPGGAAWRSRQARFWAFYTLREFLARTGERASYVFLSDGGHFDNTGVYSLIARGCRVIVAVDCGADPNRIFEDYGNLIRRCRIDFGAEIAAEVADLRELDPDRLARASYLVGAVTYSSDHLADIGDPTPDRTDGYIVVIKPSLIGHEPLDVRQYRASYPIFPQQPTTDQFFDEAQFESYRRLGICGADSAITALSSGGPILDASSLRRAVAEFRERRDKEKVVKTLNEGMNV